MRFPKKTTACPKPRFCISTADLVFWPKCNAALSGRQGLSLTLIKDHILFEKLHADFQPADKEPLAARDEDFILSIGSGSPLGLPRSAINAGPVQYPKLPSQEKMRYDTTTIRSKSQPELPHRNPVHNAGKQFHSTTRVFATRKSLERRLSANSNSPY